VKSHGTAWDFAGSFPRRSLFASVEFPGIHIRLEDCLSSRSSEYLWLSRDRPAPGPNRLGLPHGRQPASGSSELEPSGFGPRRHLSARHSVTSRRLWSFDLLWQPRWLQSWASTWFVMKGAVANTSWARCGPNPLAPTLPLLNRGTVRGRGSPVACFFPSLSHLLAPNPLGLKPLSYRIRVPNFLHRHSTHPDPDQDGSEGALAEGEGRCIG
jgi:hypothetical protein